MNGLENDLFLTGKWLIYHWKMIYLSLEIDSFNLENNLFISGKMNHLSMENDLFIPGKMIHLSLENNSFNLEKWFG